MKGILDMTKRILSIIIVTITLLLTLTACNHKHTYEFFISKYPTCQEKGELKELCMECGNLVIHEIGLGAHNYVDGYCTVCHASQWDAKKLTRTTMPFDSNNQGAWSFKKIHEFVTSSGYDMSYSDIMNTMSKSKAGFSNAYIDKWDNLHLTFTYTSNKKDIDVPLTLDISRVSPKNEEKSLGNILRIDSYAGEITITYATGEFLSAGKFADSARSAPSAPVYIIGFGINEENELVIYYSDNTIAFAGNIKVK